MAHWESPWYGPDLGVFERRSRSNTPKSGIPHGKSQRPVKIAFQLG